MGYFFYLEYDPDLFQNIIASYFCQAQPTLKKLHEGLLITLGVLSTKQVIEEH